MHKDSCIATGILRAIGGSDVGIDIIVIDTLTLHGLFISKKFLHYTIVFVFTDLSSTRARLSAPDEGLFQYICLSMMSLERRHGHL